MPSTCIFKFDRENPIYFNGETIRVCVTLTTTSEKTCREVYIELLGEAKVRWTERRNKKTRSFIGNEIYINNHTTLHPEGQLPPGTHTYNYEITLPESVASSCVGVFGHIKYEICLTIDRPYRFDNVFRRPLTVLRNFNLNLLPELLIPLQAEDIKYICCWFCRSGPIISTLTIPFGGYAPGQSIKYTLHIDNQSKGYDLNGVSLRLVQTYNFTAIRPRRKTRKVTANMAEISQDTTILRLSKRIIEGALDIPPAPPSSQFDSIITVTYHIEMAVKTGGCHRDSEIVIPIKLGTIPLYQTVVKSERIPEPDTQPTAPMPDTPSDQLPSYDNISPPYYEQATSITRHFVDTDIDAHHRVDGFLPQYPMYTNFTLPTTQ